MGYIGQKVLTFEGFTAFEICARLKNFGVGRVIARKTVWGYLKEDPSKVLRDFKFCYKLTKVGLDTSDVYFKKGIFYGFDFLTGSSSESCQIQDTYRIDWMLLSKVQEKELLDMHSKFST